MSSIRADAVPLTVIELALSELEDRAGQLRRLGVPAAADLLSHVTGRLRERIADPGGYIEWISVQEASVRLGFSESTVRRWLACDKLEGTKSGGVWLVRARGNLRPRDHSSTQTIGED